jgi:GT2 family glycosyltransferase
VRVAAIVVAWRALADLAGCLASLAAQDHEDLEVVVVDNASDDGTAALLTELDTGRHPLRVVRNPTNRGFAGGVNDGLALLDAEVAAVVLVNPDARLAPDLVRRCVSVLERAPGVGSVQPRVHRPAVGRAMPSGAVIDSTGHLLTRARLVRNRGEGVLDAGQFAQPGEVFGVSGAVACHRRAMLDDVAWRSPDGRREVLTEALFTYFDDVELDWRARLLGWQAWYEPAAVAVHQRGGAAARRTASVEALNWSNRLLVVATCDDTAALLRASPLVLVTTLLKTVGLAVTAPRALPAALGRLRLLPAARRRRRELLARARVTPAEVVARWVVPFEWRPWVATWWRRVTGRATGVARR